MEQGIIDYLLNVGTDSAIANFAKNNLLLTYIIIQTGIYIASKTKNTLDDALWGKLKEKFGNREDVIELTEEVKK